MAEAAKPRYGKRMGWGKLIALAGLALLAGCIPQDGEPRGGYDPAPRERGNRERVPSSTIDPTEAPRYITQANDGPPPPAAWEMRKVQPDARPIPASTYTVRNGDSLRLIAVKTGAGSEAIARANGIARPYTIQPGQVLRIPGGRYHLVREGETGIAIAQAYAVDWGRMVTVNELEEPYILRAGQRILIPERGRTTLEERAAAFKIDIDDIVTGGQPAVASKGTTAPASASPTRVLPATKAAPVPARLAGGFQWPLKGNILKKFGPGASGERNDGIKIAAPIDTPVLAAADGVVAYVGSDIPSLGGLVIIRHGDSWTTVYGHASQLLVQRGQSVKKGQMIALSGNSGHAERPELHFEIRQGRTPVDPIPRLPAR
jgi:lipoprotein NlpD